MTASTLPAVLTGLLGSDPARPLVTFYDDATGERVELSVRSFENWVAKTANLLQEELSTQPGEHLALWLPVHWQSAVWTCAAAACGLVVSHDPDLEATADVVACGPESVEHATQTSAREVVALSLLPMGGRFGDPLPPRVVDYAGEVLAQPDVFVPISAADADDPFLVGRDGSSSQRELLARARQSAETAGLVPAGRLLTDANPASTAGLTTGFLAAMVTGGSVVLTRHPDPAAVDARVTQERVTTQLWCGR